MKINNDTFPSYPPYQKLPPFLTPGRGPSTLSGHPPPSQLPLPPIDTAFHLLAKRSGLSGLYSSLSSMIAQKQAMFDLQNHQQHHQQQQQRSILHTKPDKSEDTPKKDQECPLDLSAKTFMATAVVHPFLPDHGGRLLLSRFMSPPPPPPLFRHPGSLNLLLHSLHHQQQQQQHSHGPHHGRLPSSVHKSSSAHKETHARRRCPGPPQPPASQSTTATAAVPGAAASTNTSSSASSGGGKQPVTSCLQCAASFPSLGELNAHFLSRHELSLIKELELAKSWKSHAVEEICMQDLEAVVKQGDIETTGYQCPHCEYFAKWPTELQKHIMVHSKERPHQCIICGLTYKWKWDLGRHFDKSHLPALNPYKKNPNPAGSAAAVAAASASSNNARAQQQQLQKQQQQYRTPLLEERGLFPPPPPHHHHPLFSACLLSHHQQHVSRPSPGRKRKLRTP